MKKFIKIENFTKKKNISAGHISIYLPSKIESVPPRVFVCVTNHLWRGGSFHSGWRFSKSQTCRNELGNSFSWWEMGDVSEQGVESWRKWRFNRFWLDSQGCRVFPDCQNFSLVYFSTAVICGVYFPTTCRMMSQFLKINIAVNFIASFPTLKEETSWLRSIVIRW